MSDHPSPKAVEAFLEGVCATIHAIDDGDLDPPIRSKGRFLEVLEAALEHISLHSPDLTGDDLKDFQRLALDLPDMVRSREFPSPDQFA